VGDVKMAPVPRARKVKIVVQEPATWAIVTRRGQPTEHAVQRAEAAIMDTIARSHWFATDAATIRIHTPAAVLPLASSFEVAVPVFRHPQDQSNGNSCRSDGVGRAPANRSANPPSPPVH
jgi:hypothetical protein